MKLDDIHNSKKLYFSIGEVADMFDVKTSLIRFWEKEFDVIKPKKNSKGNRLFTKADIENFHLIFHLVKERGFTLEGAKNKLKTNRDETVKNAEIALKLKEIRSFLVEIKEAL
ncbi:MerR family transcriptional regulator [Salibacter halophilus]|jgi:DNA-binding transcriptional MerR regulator|uniref:MerR family transcriptional regulator n=1 Tax=Salibacter halophilus TaxID=1803916 RepID=A0A6N6M3B6_9FLAO|nr:MerR family transcriptional regulator [Salibacter halophilus]KAB1061827.1 MerR family transcriptional regulator [Salibacter halophilus]